ncbi:glycosyltransferase family 4 protein [Caproiciproducens galactitolivorans]|uniref:Glycosyltransferase family 4 protein n=1 Tax=Caproiciproducens galactitolivorans TaxID=642589 RepID=A0ABT4BU85_9FIRM|nr:glycosyltransferase family 4 protein [Caproiciproducens galactitolivorans]MCY1713486.1 glycosyltransferase family 4 protein [Caproiciproducens galactitolivorans]
MGKKILFCASTISHINNFHLPYLKAFHEQGYEVWVAANKSESILYADHVVALPLSKKLMSFQNVKAIFAAKKLLKDQNFDIISTHTTLASAVIRAAIMLIHRKPKVFCTVHGYLFNENDGIKKWIYLLPEKICAHVTNVLMVMNHEDYDIAEKHKLYRDKLYYINGMGIDLSKFKPVLQEERISARREKGFAEEDFLFVYAAEFSKRKNQSLLIHAFANVREQIPNAKLLLAGDGALLEECKLLTKGLHVEKQILFLGYVEDMRKLYSACNVCVTTSRIEGLPFNVMEAMACGLPVIASDIKGHRELVEEGKTGLLFDLKSHDELEDRIIDLVNDSEKAKMLGNKGREQVEQFHIQNIFTKIMNCYELDKG